MVAIALEMAPDQGLDASQRPQVGAGVDEGDGRHGRWAGQ